MRFFGDPGDVALLEIGSPVGDNSGLHMFFFDAACDRVGDSVFLPLTTNDISFLRVTGDGGVLTPSGFFGSHPKDRRLITMANSTTGFALDPLKNPIHSRMYLFNRPSGKSRIVEPIILDTVELSGNPHTWSPLRTSVTFFAPPDGFGGHLYQGVSHLPENHDPGDKPGGRLFSDHPIPVNFARGQFGIGSIYKSAQAFASGGTFTKLETDPVSPSLPFPFTRVQVNRLWRRKRLLRTYEQW